jgi:hypothetical protein
LKIIIYKLKENASKLFHKNEAKKNNLLAVQFENFKMVHYKLNYFNFKGRAEIIRYVFALANQEYEDFGFTGEQWKQTYMAQSPLGSAPWLEIHDGSNTTVLGQSITISIYSIFVII